MTFGTAHRPYESDDPTPPVVPAHAGTQRLTPESAATPPTKKVSSLARTHVFSGFAAVRSDVFACVGKARLRHCSRRCYVAERAAGPHPRRSGSTVAWARMPLTRPCLMACAPARPRSGRGFSIRPPCLSENGRPSRPAPCGPDPPYALGSTSRVEGGGRRLTAY